MQAAAAVASGAANVVLIYRAFNERSGHRFGQPMAPGTSFAQRQRAGGDGIFRSGSHAGQVGLAALPALHAVYGVTNEDFGRYSVVCRKHAATNPKA